MSTDNGVIMRKPPCRPPRRAPAADRLPPYSPEAEQCVLGCVLLDSARALGQCVERLRDGSECFYDLRHAEVYESMLAMYEEREAVDMVTLQQRLKDKAQLEEVGGVEYLFSLTDKVPSAANVGSYLDVVMEKYLLRRLLHCCTSAVDRVYEAGNVEALLDDVEREVLAVRPAQKGATLGIKALVNDAITEIEEYHQRHGMVSGISTGFADLDKLTSGMQPGDMWVVAGFPGMGKTSLAMNIVEHVVLDVKLAVGVFTLEMTAKQLALRMLCSRARVNLRNVRDGFLAERDFPKLASSAGKVSNSLLFIDDASDLSVYQLRASARRMVQQHGVRLFVVDYLQLLTAVGGVRKVESRQQEVSDISSQLKKMGKELGVPVLVLSQLNDDGKLRESRAIGQDGDLVGVLEKPKQHEDEEDEEETNGAPVNLRIRKQRNGPAPATVNLTFMKGYTRFESAAKVSDEALEGCE